MTKVYVDCVNIPKFWEVQNSAKKVFALPAPFVSDEKWETASNALGGAINNLGVTISAPFVQDTEWATASYALVGTIAKLLQEARQDKLWIRGWDANPDPEQEEFWKVLDFDNAKLLEEARQDKLWIRGWDANPDPEQEEFWKIRDFDNIRGQL
jgi:hypothetical protein